MDKKEQNFLYFIKDEKEREQSEVIIHDLDEWLSNQTEEFWIKQKSFSNQKQIDTYNIKFSILGINYYNQPNKDIIKRVSIPWNTNELNSGKLFEKKLNIWKINKNYFCQSDDVCGVKWLEWEKNSNIWRETHLDEVRRIFGNKWNSLRRKAFKNKGIDYKQAIIDKKEQERLKSIEKFSKELTNSLEYLLQMKYKLENFVDFTKQDCLNIYNQCEKLTSATSSFRRRNKINN